jgi:hypothetical protein
VLELGAAWHAEVREERSLVECDRTLGIAACNCGEEVVAIELKREAQREVTTRALDGVLAECLPELEDSLAESAKAALRFGVGPEEVEKVLTRCGVRG